MEFKQLDWIHNLGFFLSKHLSFRGPFRRQISGFLSNFSEWDSHVKSQFCKNEEIRGYYQLVFFVLCSIQTYFRVFFMSKTCLEETISRRNDGFYAFSILLWSIGFFMWVSALKNPNLKETILGSMHLCVLLLRSRLLRD